MGDWMRNYIPSIVGVPLGGATDVVWGASLILVGIPSFGNGMLGDGAKEFGGGVLSIFGLKETLTERWVPGMTGGVLPESINAEMRSVRSGLPDDSWKNGMHSWHAGSNAAIASSLGIFMAPIQFLAGIIHETPIDWNSFKAEEHHQGTVNHLLDSMSDIVSNVFGMMLGYFLPRDFAIDTAVGVGNYIPGPGEPDPTFGGNGTYNGDPIDAWGQYPTDTNNYGE
jgi:hypothetical protein